MDSRPRAKTRRSHVDCKTGKSPFTDHSCFKKISKEHKEATIEATKDNNPYYPARKLISLYFLGFNVINVFPENGARMLLIVKSMHGDAILALREIILN